MTPELYEAVARIARHCSRSVHWVKTPNGPRMVREPLKKQHLEQHVGGGPGIGLAPIAPGESVTRAAVLDFDSHKGDVSWAAMTHEAQRVAATLRANGYAPIAFRSSGGKGIHLILLWAEPQDAYSVRAMLVAALAVHGFAPGTKGVKYRQVEVFPKQDEVPADGFGSMFVLPLCGESLPLAPETLELLNYDYAETIKAWPLSEPVPVLARASTTVNSSSTIDSASLPTLLADVRAALAAIPNEGAESLDYESWRDLAFAVHHATNGSDEGLALMREFSQRSSKYVEGFLEEKVWQYIRSDRGGKVITAATLFSKARAHGWNENIVDEFDVLPPLEATPEVSEAIEKASGKPARFAVVPVSVFAQRPAPDWHIKGVLPRAELALIIGESGAGKSFLAWDIAAAIDQGQSWRGFKTKKGRVVYVIAEGAGFFHQRIVAYHQHHSLSLDQLQIGVISDSPNLLLKEEVKSLLQSVKAFGQADVIVIDTFAQATPGANENSAEDMGTALANCKALHRATGALIVLVHHVGKDETRGARGWSGIKAAADAEITVAKREGMRTATISKMKDAPDGLVLPFRLLDVDLGRDEDGERITSCVIEHLDEAEKRGAVRQPQGANARIVWEAAHTVAALDGQVNVGEVLTLAAGEMAHDPEKKRDRRRELALRALEGLKEQGFLRIENGIVILPGAR